MMRPALAVWCAAPLSLVLAGAPSLDGRQTGAPAPAAGAQAAGIVLGQVVDADTDRPIAGAIVELRGITRAPDGGLARERVVSDADGRFVFSRLVPASYSLFAFRPGYVVAQYGQRQPGGRADTLTVGATPPVAEATVRMWRYSAISGVILDEAGEPAVGVFVHGARVTMVAGRRLLMPVAGERMTDDRGVYRLANLLPGEYVVFVRSATESAATSTASWYAEARAQASAERDWLQQFGESRAPSPSPNGLHLGEHIVSSIALFSSTAPAVTADGRLEVYRTAYHPSAATLAEATPVSLGSGEEREGVDIRLVREPAHRVSGEVTGPDGPVGLIGVRLLSEDITAFESDYELETSATLTGQDGRFTLLGVPPGRYVVKVLRVPRPDRPNRVTAAVISRGAGSRTTMSAALPPAPSGIVEVPDRPTLWAEQSVTVGGEDVDGLALRLREGARVFGRLRFEGSAAEPEALGRFAVQLTPVGGQRNSAFLRPPGAGTDGTFRTLGHPPGRYFVNVAGSVPGAPWMVKSAMLGARDLIDEPLQLEGDDVTGVVITLTDRLAEVSGTVAGIAGEGAPALVVIMPADHRAWIANGMPAARTGSTYTDESGGFRIARVRPGSYLAVALPADAAPEPDLQDPAVVTRLARLGRQVEVPERGQVSLTLSMSRVR